MDVNRLKLITNARLSALFSLFLLTCLFFICQYTLKGVGAGSSEANAMMMACLLVFLSRSSWLFWLLAFPLYFSMVLYVPVGRLFSLPSYQGLSSILSTNVVEISEFIFQIAPINFLYAGLLMLGFLCFRFLYIKFNLSLHDNKIIVLVFAFLSFSHTEVNTYYKSIYHALHEIYRITREMQHHENAWGPVSLNTNGYDRYILVIGESARADYIQAFGYPLANSPFMAKQGHVVNGLIAGGYNTVSSLSVMLTNTFKKRPNFNLNLIDLANSAGFETHWLSNQGFIGTYDTPLSFLARNSHHKQFIKHGAYDTQNTSDFLLVDKLAKVLKMPSQHRQLIVIHLYGSHSQPCERVIDFPGHFYSPDPALKDIACYVNSLQKTDQVLAQFHHLIHTAFIEQGLSYSLVYFADHGVVHNHSQDKVTLIHGLSPYSLHVPLYKISADDLTSRQCHAHKSGQYFIDGLAHWLGIVNSQLDSQYSLFDCQDDKRAEAEWQHASFTPDEPAIVTLQQRN